MVFSSHTHFMTTNRQSIDISILFFIIFWIRETPKRVLIQTVKAKMKCKLHFIRLCTACKDKTIVGKKNTLFFSF